MTFILPRPLVRVLIASSLSVCAAAFPAKADTPDRVSGNNQTIVFVYPHGSVKSQVAAAQARAQEELSGVVASVDEGNDKISVTSGNSTNDFRVQDGLIFNSVRYGDAIEFTVETIDGARTIVALRKR